MFKGVNLYFIITYVLLTRKHSVETKIPVVEKIFYNNARWIFSNNAFTFSFGSPSPKVSIGK